MSKDPSTIRSEVADMQAKAEVCNALVGGTQAMRKAGRKYLPQEPAETDKAWESRRDKTVLFPAFRDALDAMVGKPLGEPVTTENVPSKVEVALENVDLEGRDLDTFSRAWLRQSLLDGIGWVLVDYPRVPAGATLAKERELKARPYLVHVPLAKVCGWRSEADGGRHRLTQFRWRETVEEQDGDFGVKLVSRVRVWEPGQVTVYVQTAAGEWVIDPEQSGVVSLKEIPVVCFAPGQTGFFLADPPLEELAWLNVQHYQSSSDQRHVLHVARVPLLAADKDSRDAKGSKVDLGPDRLVVGLENLRFVEHTGAAIEAGRNDLQDLKEEMRLVAGKVLSRQAGGDKSATEAGLEARDGGSKLRQWTWSFQDCLEECLRFMALWTGDAAGGTVTVSTDWDDLPDPQLFTTILQARQAGELSRDTWLWNAQRFGALPPGRTAENEKALIDAEGPAPLQGTLP